MTDQVRGDAQFLMGVIDRERNLGEPGLETMYLAPPTITCRPPSESTAAKATWLMKSTLRK